MALLLLLLQHLQWLVVLLTTSSCFCICAGDSPSYSNLLLTNPNYS